MPHSSELFDVILLVGGSGSRLKLDRNIPSKSFLTVRGEPAFLRSYAEIPKHLINRTIVTAGSSLANRATDILVKRYPEQRFATVIRNPDLGVHGVPLHIQQYIETRRFLLVPGHGLASKWHFHQITALAKQYEWVFSTIAKSRHPEDRTWIPGWPRIFITLPYVLDTRYASIIQAYNFKIRNVLAGLSPQNVGLADMASPPEADYVEDWWASVSGWEARRVGSGALELDRLSSP